MGKLKGSETRQKRVLGPVTAKKNAKAIGGGERGDVRNEFMKKERTSKQIQTTLNEILNDRESSTNWMTTLSEKFLQKDFSKDNNRKTLWKATGMFDNYSRY